MPDRDIIVIGGPAGATAPLKDILGRLPVDMPAAIVIVLHIPARDRSSLDRGKRCRGTDRRGRADR